MYSSDRTDDDAQERDAEWFVVRKSERAETSS